MGTAAGVCFAFQATVTKAFDKVVGHGIGAVLSSWTIYVLIASALAGFALQQSGLKTGVLAPALASSNAVTLFASVVFGLTVFGETLAHGSGRLVPAFIGLAIALVGIVMLAGQSPHSALHRAPPPGRPSQEATADSPDPRYRCFIPSGRWRVAAGLAYLEPRTAEMTGSGPLAGKAGCDGSEHSDDAGGGGL